MATRIRLKRTGAKHNPHFRVVVMDQHKPRDGRTVEEIGYYDPSTDPATVSIDAERAQYWLSTGAIPSETVGHLLKRAGLVSTPGAAAAPETPATDAAVQQ